MSKKRLKSPRARLFVALDLPDDVRSELEAWQAGALSDPALRPVSPAALHVTLCFLGYHPERAIEKCRVGGHDGRAATRRDPVRGRSGRCAAEAPAAVRGGGTEPAASALQAQLEERLIAARFYKPEKREFWTHVTVARVRSERGSRGRGGRGKPMRVETPPEALPCRAHAAVRNPSNSALPLVFAAFGRRIRPTRRVESDAGRRKVMKKMAQEKKANLKAADKAADKEAKAKDAALKAAETQIEREFGQGSLMRLGDAGRDRGRGDPHRGAVARPRARRRRGATRRIVEIFGPESSGKTTLVYHIIAEAQALGGVCAFVDAEHAIDPIYANGSAWTSTSC